MSRPVAFAVAVLVSGSAFAQEVVTVAVAESEEYGRFLSVGERPAYLFTADTPGTPAEPPVISCIGECLDAWPLIWADGGAEAGEGARSELLGTMEHEGRTVVTYNGWPLYRFERDAEGGPPTGQEIDSFGGTWLLIDPEGAPIRGEGA
jgi:predicted lipoprotein with Yx(FWY)xxD motif